MPTPGVYLTLPSWDVFKFPPDPLPPTLPPPIGEGTFRSPFGIQPWLYNLVLHPIVPFSFAAVYILVILQVNAYNRSRGNQPWWISRQKPFQLFVILHNVALAIYSFATFIAMLRAISHTLPELSDGTGTAGLADALCKLHGPRTLGDAISYNTTLSIWESKNQLIKLTGTGSPDPTDAGRLWNEGLAFWGWLFYLSKFYEVIDSFIIVSKGKRSATLQTYHHAGVMLCMWAGMRYMSPPIWMFVFVNSFIHSLMYVYYALASVGYRVPESYKRALTSIQIFQFLWGFTYAALHLFVSYDIPMAIPYQVLAKVAAAASTASSSYVSASSAASSAVSSFIETPTINSSLGLLIKKLLLRAAGEEGAAERLAGPAVTGQPLAERIESKLEEVKDRIFHQPTYETKWRTEYTRVNCIDTSGEAFAIMLNLVYLAPLTMLFARFFFKNYLSRSGKSNNIKQAVNKIKDDVKQAEIDTERTVEKAGKRAEDVVKDGSAELKKQVSTLYDQLREDVRKMKKGEYTSPKFNERLDKFQKQVDDLSTKAKHQAKSTTESVKQQAKSAVDSAKQQAQAGTESRKDADDDESDEEHEDKENQAPSPGQSSSPDKKKKKHKNKKKHSAAASGSGNVHAEDESAAKQDAILAASEPTRPGTTDAIDDSDAMGKSGVGVDLSKSVADSTTSNQSS